jgi:hypothetical protein
MINTIRVVWLIKHISRCLPMFLCVLLIIQLIKEEDFSPNSYDFDFLGSKVSDECLLSSFTATEQALAKAAKALKPPPSSSSSSSNENNDTDGGGGSSSSSKKKKKKNKSKANAAAASSEEGSNTNDASAQQQLPPPASAPESAPSPSPSRHQAEESEEFTDVQVLLELIRLRHNLFKCVKTLSSLTHLADAPEIELQRQAQGLIAKLAGGNGAGEGGGAGDGGATGAGSGAGDAAQAEEKGGEASVVVFDEVVVQEVATHLTALAEAKAAAALARGEAEKRHAESDVKEETSTSTSTAEAKSAVPSVEVDAAEGEKKGEDEDEDEEAALAEQAKAEAAAQKLQEVLYAVNSDPQVVDSELLLRKVSEAGNAAREVRCGSRLDRAVNEASQFGMQAKRALAKLEVLLRPSLMALEGQATSATATAPITPSATVTTGDDDKEEEEMVCRVAFDGAVTRHLLGSAPPKHVHLPPLLRCLDHLKALVAGCLHVAHILAVTNVNNTATNASTSAEGGKKKGGKGTKKANEKSKKEGAGGAGGSGGGVGGIKRVGLLLAAMPYGDFAPSLPLAEPKPSLAPPPGTPPPPPPRQPPPQILPRSLAAMNLYLRERFVGRQDFGQAVKELMVQDGECCCCCC